MEQPSLCPESSSAKAIESSEILAEPCNLMPGQMNFDGPIKTTADLKDALIQMMGNEKGQEMYDNFITSILTTTFGTINKDMDRAQKASKRMRAVYKDL